MNCIGIMLLVRNHYLLYNLSYLFSINEKIWTVNFAYNATSLRGDTNL